MRFWLKIGVFIMAIGLVQGQDLSQLDSYLLTSQATNREEAKEKVGLLLAKLESRSKKSDKQFLKSVFNLTHRQILKEYDQYSGFGDLFTTGQYDCLTATALYSVILQQLGYEHSIIETNYHIFLLVETDEGQVLMESTDPLDGFEFLPEKIEARINLYKSDQAKIIDDMAATTFNLFDEVSPGQLVGLLYYNQSVKSFNHQDWLAAVYFLSESKKFYNSPRTEELENLLLSIASIELQPSGNNSMGGNYQIAQRDQ